MLADLTYFVPSWAGPVLFVLVLAFRPNAGVSCMQSCPNLSARPHSTFVVGSCTRLCVSSSVLTPSPSLRPSSQMVVGWYHSHPGFGCWLSGVDINTQQSFEQLNPRAVSIVVDPIQSVKGKVGGSRNSSLNGSIKLQLATAYATLNLVCNCDCVDNSNLGCNCNYNYLVMMTVMMTRVTTTPQLPP